MVPKLERTRLRRRAPRLRRRKKANADGNIRHRGGLRRVSVAGLTDFGGGEQSQKGQTQNSIMDAG
jgi:hypothetical protein